MTIKKIYEKRKALALTLAFIGIILLGCDYLAWSKAGQPSDLNGTTAKVAYELVRKVSDAKLLTYPVKVEPVIASSVVAEIDGTVKKIVKSLGSTVKAGDVILVIQNNDPAFTYASVAVRAPFRGVVTQIQPNLYSKVARGDKLVTVVQPGKLKMTAEVPETELSYLKQRQDGIFNTDNYSDIDAVGIYIDGVSPVVDPKTNTAQVDIKFFPKQKLLNIGTVGYAKFFVPLADSIKVPASSVSFFEGKPFVRLVDDSSSVKKKYVELDAQVGTDLIIKSGLVGGEKLIIRSARPLKEGEKVEAAASARAE